MQKKPEYLLLITLFSFLFFFSSCIKFKPVSTREYGTNSQERAKKNIDEGRGVSVGSLLGNKGNNTFQFSSSNPMWRASLQTLDFLPLSVVDYSGGILITDWYADEVNSGSSLKITLRFLSNEVRADSLKIIVHEKKCSPNTNNTTCSIKVLNSAIKRELLASIIRKAALLELEAKRK